MIVMRSLYFGSYVMTPLMMTVCIGAVQEPLKVEQSADEAGLEMFAMREDILSYDTLLHLNLIRTLIQFLR